MKGKRRSTGLLSEESIRRLHKKTEITAGAEKLSDRAGDEQPSGGSSPENPPFSGKEYVRGEVRALWAEDTESVSAPEKKRAGQKTPPKESPPAEAKEVLEESLTPPPEYEPRLGLDEGVNRLSLHRNGFLEYYQAAHLDGLEKRQVLELILQFAVPLRNTAPLADELLERFGSFYGVLGAGVDQLMTVKGMTREACVLLDMFIRVARLAVDEQNTGNDLLNTDERVAQYLINKFFGLTTETIMMLCLDNTCRLISCTALAQGSACVSRISTRRVFEIALGCNAANVILAHNHPGGIAYPSQEDIRATEAVSKLLKSLDVELLDHVILAGKEWCSMARMGCLAVRRITTR